MISYQRTVRLLFCLAMVFPLLSACSSGSSSDSTATGDDSEINNGDDTGGGSETDNGDDTGDVTGGTDNAGATALEGTWKLCQNLSDISDSTTFTFQGNTFTEVKERHSDNDCNTLQNEIVSYTGTFTLGQEITTDSGAAASAIDLQYLTGFALNQQPVFYDIVQVVNSNLLYRGNVATGSTLSESQRPTDVSYSIEYIKQ